jgi:hypothetical protein
MAYAIRTCEKCGIRKPQNEMIEAKKTQTAASINPSRKKSGRLYVRDKKVFYCKSCGKPFSFGTFLAVCAVVILGIMALV